MLLILKGKTNEFKHEEQEGNSFVITTDPIEMTPKENELTIDLKQAIKKESLHLYYQPILNDREEIVAMEALLRWNHPNYGFISPETIIDLAERNGLIIELGEWILKTACYQAKQWQQDYHVEFSVSVNISPLQLMDPHYITKVEKLLKQINLHPKYLELEITERVKIFDLKNIRATLLKLKNLGVLISIDDFGTGYSSLEYIDQLPIDRIKIDKLFVMNIDPIDEKTHAIAKTVITLAEKLNLEVVAEGVESLYQFKLLAENACHRFQGYYFYKPLDPKDCTGVFTREMVTQN
jgi:EAL domain-containing protein (putative c-di-GMP-specific phosphodiesterase class I)